MKVAPSLFLEFTGTPSSLDEQAALVGNYRNIRDIKIFL